MSSDFQTTLRSYRRETQAAAFDFIGERYDEAFPRKDGQLAAGRWVLDRLGSQARAGARVLDAGCGTGLPTARQLVEAGARVTAIDISPVMLDLARANVPEADCRLLDLTDVDGRLGSFDAVVAFFSLLMLPRALIPDALERLRGVLRPGGWFALAMVEADVDYVPIPFLGMSVHVSGFFLEELRRLTIEAGFEVVAEHSLRFAPRTGQALPEVQQFLYCRRPCAPGSGKMPWPGAMIE